MTSEIVETLLCHIQGTVVSALEGIGRAILAWISKVERTMMTEIIKIGELILFTSFLKTYYLPFISSDYRKYHSIKLLNIVQVQQSPYKSLGL